jgi:hypothetical protein
MCIHCSCTGYCQLDPISFLQGILYFVIYNIGLTWIFPIIDPYHEFVSVPEFVAIGVWLFFGGIKSR